MQFPMELDAIIRKAYQSDANVLITGPTGSGKTYLAKQIHTQSRRGHQPFVVVNLASLHEGTFESELFGHERGAFTGAQQRRIGRLEMAQGGTLFLDEIGELTPRLQARLLEFLQFKTLSPVGSNRQITLDLRVIAATNKNLAQSCARGEFREDLFYRLRVVCISLLPLAQRPDDLDRLVHECLEELCKQTGRSVLRISEGVARKLETYPWPGNLRELRNVLEYAVLASEKQEITSTDLPPWFHEAEQAPQNHSSENKQQVLGVAEIPMTLDFQDSISRFEKQYLKLALQRFRGRINRTACQIGMNKTTLLRRMRAYGLHPNYLEQSEVMHS